jgi:hypothetical protein
MNKIYEIAKEPLSGKINFRVNPEHTESFKNFLDSHGYLYITDGNKYPICISDIGEVICHVFLMDFSDKLKDDVLKWDSL